MSPFQNFVRFGAKCPWDILSWGILFFGVKCLGAKCLLADCYYVYFSIKKIGLYFDVEIDVIDKLVYIVVFLAHILHQDRGPRRNGIWRPVSLSYYQ